MDTFTIEQRASWSDDGEPTRWLALLDGYGREIEYERYHDHNALVMFLVFVARLERAGYKLTGTRSDRTYIATMEKV